MELHAADCFKINIKFWKYLGIWPGCKPNNYYKCYSYLLIIIFVIVYGLLGTINFYYLPLELDLYIEDMVFYFAEIAVLSKVLTFVLMNSKLIKLFDILNSEIFQPADEDSRAIILKAKNFNLKYWRVMAMISFTSHLTHIASPVLVHIFKSVDLNLPICSYSFLSDEFKQAHIYILYLYESVGMDFHVLYNINIDTFFLGLMIYVRAQLDILDIKLRKVTDTIENVNERRSNIIDSAEVKNLNQCIIHYGEVEKFCSLIQSIFSVSIFVQFNVASCIICICLFRFTMPGPLQYYIFLGTYTLVMVIQILIPCWFGTQIIEKSNRLAFSLYNCDWITKSHQFKSSLLIFVERTNRPLNITGGKMFCLSLTTFTSIMKNAYSFFTLLQNVQARQ